MQMGPQGAVCGNDITGSEDHVKGSNFARELSPLDSCMETSEDIANDMPPVEHDDPEQGKGLIRPTKAIADWSQDFFIRCFQPVQFRKTAILTRFPSRLRLMT